MKFAKKEVVRNYQRNKHAWLWWIATWIGMVLFLMLLIGGFAVVMIIIAFFRTPIRDPYLFAKDKKNEFYPLLRRWEKFSGHPLEDFPTTEFLVRATACWMAVDLWTLAVFANHMFEIQKEKRRRCEEYLKNKIGYPDMAHARQLERDVALVNARAKNAQAMFLGLWDLATEKNGIGALSGPDWDDPERFRQRVACGTPSTGADVDVKEPHDLRDVVPGRRRPR